MGIVRRLAIWELTSTSQRLGQKNKKKKAASRKLQAASLTRTKG
jgi:hypothetical protein